MVLDPFAGTGTTGKAAVKLNRRFALLEQDEKYINLMRADFAHLNAALDIDWVNVETNYNETLF